MLGDKTVRGGVVLYFCMSKVSCKTLYKEDKGGGRGVFYSIEGREEEEGGDIHIYNPTPKPIEEDSHTKTSKN